MAVPHHSMSVARESMPAHRAHLGNLIAERIALEKERCWESFWQCSGGHYFVVDNLLPEALVDSAIAQFPQPSEMLRRKNLREHKYMTAQMNRCAPILEELVFAFQTPQVVQIISEITGCQDLSTDPDLYVGGLTLMPQQGFMNPHIDKSHDRAHERYRVLNLLYYISPDWRLDYGGNFELWRDGRHQPPLEILSRYNRLLVIASTQRSLHSVSPVTVNRQRCCVVNYYFSPVPFGYPEHDHYYTSTAFRGRPDQRWRDALLVADGWLRSTGRQLLHPLFRRRILQNPHFYDHDRPSSARDCPLDQP